MAPLPLFVGHATID
jgi:hypothetical protein